MSDTAQPALQRKFRDYTMRISVAVDDASKYEVEMDKLCQNVVQQLKEICKNFDRGTGRLEVEVTRAEK